MHRSFHTNNITQRQVDAFSKAIFILVKSVLKPAMDRGVVKGQQVKEVACPSVNFDFIMFLNVKIFAHRSL